MKHLLKLMDWSEKEIAEGKVQKNVAEILVEKHRSGPTGVVKLYFRGECTKFINLNEETGEIEVATGLTAEDNITYVLTDDEKLAAKEEFGEDFDIVD